MKSLKRILLVHSRLDEIKTFVAALESNSFDVSTYEDSQNACDEFMPNKYDLVIVSIRMPKLNGFDVYRHIKKSDPKVNIILMTPFEIYPEEFVKMFPKMRDVSFIRLPINIAYAIKHIRDFAVQ